MLKYGLLKIIKQLIRIGHYCLKVKLRMEKDKDMEYNIIQMTKYFIKDNSKTVNIVDGVKLNNMKANGNMENDMVMVY